MEFHKKKIDLSQQSYTYIIYYSEDTIMRLAMQRTYLFKDGPINPASKLVRMHFSHYGQPKTNDNDGCWFIVNMSLGSQAPRIGYSLMPRLSAQSNFPQEQRKNV